MNRQNYKNLEIDVIKYFLEYTVLEKESKGYGLTLDHSNHPTKASIAASGFFFPALILAKEQNIVNNDEFNTIVKQSLKTLQNVKTFHGFFPHFIDTNTGQRFGLCEYSTIDTTLLIAGLLVLDQYAEDSNIHKDIMCIINQVEWDVFVKDETYFMMAYNPDKDGDYITDQPGFVSKWDMFAEQLLLYIIMAGIVPDKEMTNTLYNSFERLKSKELIYPPHNTLFIYHMPLCFLDLRELYDQNGVNWHDNAILGTQSHVDTAQLLKQYPTFQQGYFGMNASDTKEGYRVFGALPNIARKPDTDGTIAPYSIIGSLPYNEQAQNTLDKMVSIPGLYQKYGFKDAFDINQGYWISSKYISIDKGIELLSFEQLENDYIRTLFMKHSIIKKGLENLGFLKKGKK